MTKKPQEIGKRVLLIDADSTIPNLALMKLSQHYKYLGYSVSLKKLHIPYYPSRKKIHHTICGNYDKIYCSVLFEGSIDYIHGKNINFGGTGYSEDKPLSDDIESELPDYSLYPENNTSYGFITRGCIRNCKFCKVPEKEGYIHQVNEPKYISKHKKTKFLDSNILAIENHKDILSNIINLNIKCQFNQGLDIRLVDRENSILLSNLNYFGNYIFAFDDYKLLPIIEDKLKLLKWRKDWQFKFFVYCSPDMEITNIVKRIEYLKSKKILPYLMRNISCWDSSFSDFYVDIAAYCNQPNIIKKMTFNKFLDKRHLSEKSNDRKENSRFYYYRNLEECK